MSAAGTWYNELGSKMELQVNGSSLTGTYQTAVGDATGIYLLVGSLDPAPSPGGQAIAWVVVWNNEYGNSHSITAWSGQYQVIQGEEEIVSLWLLTSEQMPNHDWKSTLVNQDVFTRTAPSQQSIERAASRRPPSHPA